MPYVDSETVPALVCNSKTTHIAAVFRDVADGSFSLVPTTEHHVVEFVKKDSYNAYFQDLFASSIRSEVCPHLKWEGWFAALGDIGTLDGKAPKVSLPDVAVTFDIANDLGRGCLIRAFMRSQRCSISPPWRGGGGCLGRNTGRPLLR